MAHVRFNLVAFVSNSLPFILRYSKEHDLILDQFAGGGTTLIEAKLLNRNIIGVDINKESLIKCRNKCNFDYKTDGKVYLKNADARNLDFIPNDKIDFIPTIPANPISTTTKIATSKIS